jgi:radical SAM-linked protein
VAARQPEGPPPPPTVQRLRLRYAKRGRLRFSSHRDFQRALERALRRAAVPVAYSAGFSPHPKVSYANAAPTGTASEAEYVELGLAEVCDPERVRVALDASLPPGLDVVEVVEAGPGSLAERLEASDWRIALPGLPPPEAERAVTALLAAETVVVDRLMKDGKRALDARAPIVTARVETDPESGCAILALVVRHVTPAVRPDDVVTALRVVADLAPPAPGLWSWAATRMAQGPLQPDGTVSDPLDPDRAAVGAAAPGPV